MARKTRAELDILYADNTNGDISESDLREGFVSAFIVLDDDTDDITEGANNKFVSATEKAKIGTNETAINTHTANTSNPHNVTKAQVGLSAVDNTADLDKPVSTATQSALDGKAATSHTHTAANVSDFDTEVENNSAVAANTAARHSHANKATLDTYTQTEINLADAVTKKHTHANNAVLDAITDEGSGIVISAAERTKLNGIEASATADQTGAEIKALYEAESDTNAFTDAEKSKLAGLESSKFLGSFTTLSGLQTAYPSPAVGSYADVDAGASSDVQRYIWDDSDNQYVLQTGSGGSETASSIKTKYESNADTENFNTASKTKVDFLTVTAAANIDNIKTHTESTTGNPHSVTKSDVGLGNADNTADLDKPISTLTQAALNGKANTSHTHTAANISDFDTEVENNTDVSANTTNRHSHANKALIDTYTQTEANLADVVSKKHEHSNKSILDAITDEGSGQVITSTERTKLSGVASGAIANVIEDTTPELGGNLNQNNKVSYDSLNTYTPAGTTQTIDFATGHLHSLDLGSASGNITLTFSNPQTTSYLLKVVQGATARTLTFPASVLWAGGTAPTISTADNAIDVFTFIYDGTNYLGLYQQNFS